MADVIVLGGGLAGLTSAIACADRGLEVLLVDSARPGAASSASAGVLGPSIGRGPKSGRVGRFMFAARDRYPSFLAELEARTGIVVPTVTGAIELALNETHLDELRARGKKLEGSELLDARAIAALEPALVAVAGGLFHPRDGALDVAVLLDALRAAAAAQPRITISQSPAVSITFGRASPSVAVAGGATHHAAHVVVAAGAWSGAVRGLPRAIPVRPVKGEIAIARGADPIRHVVFGAGGYLVPRGGDLLVGATSAEAGFDTGITTKAADELQLTARALLHAWPAASAPLASQRAGLRPMTPDGYPILGCDPDAAGLIYACGYSRNGVLLSPLAADCVASLVLGEESAFDLSAFSVSRFGG